MSTFSFLSDIFSDERELSAEERGKLFEELMLLTLSRASRADLDTSEVEVAKIQKVLKESADIDVSVKEIRVAAMSELYEEAPLEKYAAKAAQHLSVANRRAVIRALYDVISANDNVSGPEADFLDTIADIMNLRPSELLGADIDHR